MSADPLEGRERARFEEWCPIKILDPATAPKANTLVNAYWTAWQARAEQDRWISVEERLPDVSVEDVELVLGAMPGAVYCSLFRKATGRFHYLGKDAGPISGITHWQPLPKAPAPPVHKGDS